MILITKASTLNWCRRSSIYTTYIQKPVKPTAFEKQQSKKHEVDYSRERNASCAQMPGKTLTTSCRMRFALGCARASAAKMLGMKADEGAHT